MLTTLMSRRCGRRRVVVRRMGQKAGSGDISRYIDRQDGSCRSLEGLRLEKARGDDVCG